MSQKLIQQGAEAKIILLDNNIIIKDRITKSYRHSELDKKIIKSRTKAETKLLLKAGEIINTPKPEEQKEINQIIIPFIKGKKLSDWFDKFPTTQQHQICRKIGEDVAKLHDENIIHGDLTTSNMILVEKNAASQKDKLITNNKIKNSNNKSKIFFIDFGLGFHSHRIEDKSVDLHLLRQALEAKHFKHWQKNFEQVLKGYSKSTNSKQVIKQLEKVEARGRYKH